MKKNKKSKQQEVRINFSDPYSVSHPETKTPEEKGIIYWLKKIFTVQGITTIIAVVSLTFVIIDHLPKSEKEKLKENIEKNIPEAKKQLNSYIIPHELDSLEEVKIMREFKNNASSYINTYENEFRNFGSETTKQTKESVIQTVESYKARYTKLFEYQTACNENAQTLVATLAKKGSTSFSIISLDLLDDMKKQGTKATTATLEQIDKAVKAATGQNMDKTIEYLKIAFENEDYLKYMDMNMEFILMINRVIQLRIAELQNEHNL